MGEICKICGKEKGEPLGHTWKEASCEELCQISHHTKADAPECWQSDKIPGYTQGTVRDTLGNEYKHGIHVDGWDSGNYYIEIRLDGKYTTFSGICGCPERDATIHPDVYTPEGDHTKYFEVRGDGHFLGRSATMRFDYAPEPFTIDVTGVQVLRIVYPYGRSPNEVATIFDGLLS